MVATPMEPAPRGMPVSGVEAEINYIRNPPDDRSGALEFVTEREAASTIMTRPGRPMWIANARAMPTDLDGEGFVLVEHHSGVADFDRIQEDPAVDAQYSEEMSSLVTELTGAARVIMLGGGKKRYGEPATDKWARLSNAKPARYPHADNTDASAQGLAAMMAELGGGMPIDRYSRYVMYNVWRSVSPPPQDFPLAVCDVTSVELADEVTVTAITEEGGAEIRHDTTSYVHNPGHRWCYFTDMTPDEVLVFKSHDTDPACARRVPHTAFTDPTCPKGVPTRASVEARALALFD